MEVKVIDKLEDRICDELERMAQKTGTMTTAEIDSMNKLIVAKEKLMKIEQMTGYSQRRYSGDGKWYAMGDYDNSYDRNGEHYVRGHYSREDGRDMMMDRMSGDMYDRMSRDDRNAIMGGR